MIFVCIEWNYSDTSLALIEHDNVAEVIAVLSVLGRSGPDLVASGDMIVAADYVDKVQPLGALVAGHLFETYEGPEICEHILAAVPLHVLRDAVNVAVAREENALANPFNDAESGNKIRARIAALREALEAREARVPIGVDLCPCGSGAAFKDCHGREAT